MERVERRRARGARPPQHRRHARPRSLEPPRRLLRRRLTGFVLAELAEDGLLPCQYGRIEELDARGDAELERALIQAAVDWLWQHDVFVIRTELELGESSEVVESLGFQAETTRFGLYRDG